MICFNKIAVITALVALYLPGAKSNPYTISDDRVRSLDITPSLGRGYSINTNSFQSTCLDVKDTTVPSYNYKYEFHDFIDKKRQEDIVEESTNTTTVTTTQIDTEIRKIRQELRESFSVHYVVDTYTYTRYYWWWSYRVTYSVRRPVTRRNTYTVPVEYTDTSTQTTQSERTQITPGPITNTTTKSNKHMVVSTMRLERYYSSLSEQTSSIMPDAVTLLDAQDYVGFFKACGPNYVRGIRRAQEVTGIFTFEAETVFKAELYAKNLRSPSNVKSSTKASSNSLEIKIIGYGLGLNVVGSGNLQATTLEEYYEAMKFAFRSMTQSKDSYLIGQVYGIEVVPWVDSTAFIVAARLIDEVIQIPLPRSLIPKAQPLSTPGLVFNNTDEANRLQFRCKDTSYQIDKYGQCCEENSLYNHITREYDNFPPISTKVCRPLRTLDPTMVRNNLIGNGEFIARLDRTLRYKMNQLATLQQCISAARAIPNRNNYNILKDLDTVHDMHVDTLSFSLLELKLALDPFNDYGMVRHLTKEVDEFVEMFYQPCMAALFGTYQGTNPNTDPSFLMAYPWHTHKDCLHMSCFAQGMRWNRETGGCIPGLIAGAEDAGAYDTGDNFCSKDPDFYDSSSLNEQCKHNTTELNTFYGRAKTCWEGAIPAGRIDYYLENYCMPSIIPEKISPEHQIALSVAQATDCEAQEWPDNTKTNPFRIIKKDTKQQLVIAGTCTDGIRIRKQSTVISPGGNFVYDLSDYTLSLKDCDKVLTPSCDATSDLTLEDKNVSPENSYQRWMFNNDGSIKNMDCMLSGETSYLTVLPGSDNMGLGDTPYTTEADFYLSWLNEEY